MTEPLVITHHQNKTLTPMAGSVVGDGGASERGAGGEEEKKKEKNKKKGVMKRWEGRDWRIHGRQEGYTVERGVSALL